MRLHHRFAIHATLAALLGVLGLLSGGVAQAKSNTSFDPEFIFAYGYTNNLSFGEVKVDFNTVQNTTNVQNFNGMFYRVEFSALAPEFPIFSFTKRARC